MNISNCFLSFPVIGGSSAVGLVNKYIYIYKPSFTFSQNNVYLLSLRKSLQVSSGSALWACLSSLFFNLPCVLLGTGAYYANRL